MYALSIKTLFYTPSGKYTVIYESQRIVILLDVVKSHEDNSKLYLNVGFFFSFKVGGRWVNEGMDECLFDTQ